jgi:hypothetical protein
VSGLFANLACFHGDRDGSPADTSTRKSVKLARSRMFDVAGLRALLLRVAREEELLS